MIMYPGSQFSHPVCVNQPIGCILEGAGNLVVPVAGVGMHILSYFTI
jgi:hypothetical protein